MMMLAGLLLGNTHVSTEQQQPPGKLHVGKQVSKSTIKSIKNAYIKQMKKRPCNREDPVDHLPPKK